MSFEKRVTRWTTTICALLESVRTVLMSVRKVVITMTALATSVLTLLTVLTIMFG